MIRISSRVLSLRSFAKATLASAMLLGIAGCGADVMNLSSKAQREGLALYNEGQYDEAAGTFRNSIRENPRNYKSFYYLGACYDSMKQYQLAAQAYRSSLDVMPFTMAGDEDVEFRARTLDALATAIARGDSGVAQLVREEQNSTGQAKVENAFLLAKVYRYTGDVDGALDTYNRATMLDKKNFAIAKEYGLYLIQVGQSQKAERPLKRAYSINSRDAQVNAALRQLGIVPGPTIRDTRDLSQPNPTGMLDSTAATDLEPTAQTPRD